MSIGQRILLELHGPQSRFDQFEVADEGVPEFPFKRRLHEEETTVYH
ncbi:hypothetical protein [Streptomyces sp. MK37H]|nr:hypothetical protein [Streptomyces sp. MK37H]